MSNKYVKLTSNGRMFPNWVQTTFKKYKLNPIFRNENEDPCDIDKKLSMRLYQEFIGKYIGPDTPYNEILLYHGLGSGKTVTAINLLDIYNAAQPDMNVIILIKASLRDDPWIKDMKRWMGRDPNTDLTDEDDREYWTRMKNIHFVHYDSPSAGKDFMNLIKTLDMSLRTMFVIDEAHNFIRNVNSNLQPDAGDRARIIYDFILDMKKAKPETIIVLISATPAINIPFELALLYNLLRPGIFPGTEGEFNRNFVSKGNVPILEPSRRNQFERRILGLTSYYIGATPDLFAKKILHQVNLPMSQYQYEIYRGFEKIEQEIEAKSKRFARGKSKTSTLFKTYTRLACNFVFPPVSPSINGESRPRPGAFQREERLAQALVEERGSEEESNGAQSGPPKKSATATQKYLDTMSIFIGETERYFENIKAKDRTDGRTVQDDINEWAGGDFLEWYESPGPKSRLTRAMYDSSPKMTAIAFHSYLAPGKVMIFSNYVENEGTQIMSMYLRLVGFNPYELAEDYMGYTTIHGKIQPADRKTIRNLFNSLENVDGIRCKVILLSQSSAEGIELRNVREVHILEPYWNEVRIQQAIGRALRQCSHRDLPPDERIVDIYRYKVVKPDVLQADDNTAYSTDQYIEDQAKVKSMLLESFLSAMKEAAVDCELFKSHNMLSQSYQCFRFGQSQGPAYKLDLIEDRELDSGLYANKSQVARVKVIKIQAVTPVDPSPKPYWMHPVTFVAYDYDTHFPVGKIKMNNGVPDKINDDTYILID